MTSSVPESVERLSEWMRLANVASVRSLCRLSGVSRRQIEKLRCGDTHGLSVHHALALAKTLNISLTELLQLEPSSGTEGVAQDEQQVEYQHLKAQMETVRSQAFQTFQADTLHTLETLLLQWPTAAYAAQSNPELPAIRILPLLKPLEQLLEKWQVEPIGQVGEVVPYNPQCHQWADDKMAPEPEHPVQMSHVGYRQGDRLLYRAKVRFKK